MPDQESLAQRLKELRARHPDTDPQVVAEVVRAVLASMSGDLTAGETRLLAQVEELGRTIGTAKAEIAALSVDDINDSHIPSATDELDAIVQHTAAATDTILETCETLDRVAGEIGGDTATVLQDATMKIYEACSFQDITGQRISKIVATLKTIDSKVEQMVAAFGPRDGRQSLAVPPPPAPDVDPLLNGPQLAAAAMDQTDIDQLLASFD